MADYYVATDGNDGADGSVGAPWRTIDYGVGRLAAGDTLLVRDGTYHEAVTINNFNGTPSQPITVKGHPGETAIMDGQSGVGGPNDGLPVGNNLVNENVPTKPGVNWQGHPLKDLGYYYNAMIRSYVGNVVIEDLTIQHSMGRGVDFVPLVNNPAIENIVIRNLRIDDTRLAAIYIFSGSGIGFEDTKRITRNTLIEDGVFTRTGMDAPYPRATAPGIYDPYGRNHGAALGMGHVDDITIRNCTLSEVYGEGIFVNSRFGIEEDGIYYCARNALVEHCTLFNVMRGTLVAHACRDVVFDSNLIYYTGINKYGWNCYPAVGIVLESTESQLTGYSGSLERVVVKNNIVIGGEQNLQMRPEGQEKGLADIEIYNNTFINAVKTWQVRFNILSGGGNWSGVNKFQNNIVIQDPELGVPLTNAAPSGTMQSNHNFWSSSPQAGWLGGGDLLGDALLVNHRAQLVPGAVDPNNYKLKNGSRAINAGDSSVPVQFDYFDAVRSTHDMGMNEHGASTAYATAEFTSSVQSGDAPLGVQLTDQSTATNGVVGWLWTFGDGGNSTGRNPIHTYSEPGTYTIALQIVAGDGLTDTETKTNYITVTDPEAGTGPGSDGSWQTGVFTNRTTDGHQDIPHNLGQVPQGVLFFASGATILGDNKNDAIIGSGAIAGGSQFASGGRSLIGWSPANSRGFKQGDSCLIYQTSGGDIYNAEFVSWDSTKITINWLDGPPQAYQIQFLVFAGETITADAITYDDSYGSNWDVVDAGESVNIGFQPDVLICSMHERATDDFFHQTPDHVFGIKVRNGGERGIAQANEGNVTPSNVTSFSRDRFITWTDGAYVTATINALGFDIVPKGANLQGPLHILAIKADGTDFWAGKVTAPTTTGNADYTNPGWQPDVMIAAANAMQSAGSEISGDDAGAFTLYAMDTQEQQYSVSIGSRDGQDPAQERSHAANDLTVIDKLGVVQHQGVGSFIPTGWRWAMSVADSTPRTEWIAFAARSLTAPSAKFSLNEITGIYGETIFQVEDLSSSNGLGELTYEYAFGDGFVSSGDPEPSYIYPAAGQYTIVQTVTGGGSDSTFEIVVNVFAPAPTAAFELQVGGEVVTEVAPNVAVDFVSNSVAGGNETLTTWEWVVFVGSDPTQNVVTTSNLENFSYAFSETVTGASVQLRVVQGDARMREDTLLEQAIINVIAVPVASFIHAPISESEVINNVIVGPVNLRISLQDTSTVDGAAIIYRQWRVINSLGQILATVNGAAFFEWTFNEAETYSIRLEIIDSLGTSAVTETTAIANATERWKHVVGPPTAAPITVQSQGLPFENSRKQYVHDHQITVTAVGAESTIMATDGYGGTRLEYFAIGTDAQNQDDRNKNRRMLVEGTIDFRGSDSGIGSSKDEQVTVYDHLIPYKNYAVDLGSGQRKYGEIHGAALVVDTLVRREVLADIGGRIVVAQTASLEIAIEADSPYATLIFTDYKPGDFGDYLYMEAEGQWEVLRINSEPVDNSPFPGYVTTVDRAVEGVEYDWLEGTALVNIGGALYNGELIKRGFIDIYSQASIKTNMGFQVDGNGPTITGNVRYGTNPLDFGEAWAIGNMRGLYGFNPSIGESFYGIGLGEYQGGKGTYMTITPNDGQRFFSGDGIKPSLEVLRIHPTQGFMLMNSGTGTEQQRLSFYDSSEDVEHGYIGVDNNGTHDMHIWNKLVPEKAGRLILTNRGAAGYINEIRLTLARNQADHAGITIIDNPNAATDRQIVLYTNLTGTTAVDTGVVTIPEMPTSPADIAGSLWYDTASGQIRRVAGSNDR